MFGLRKRSSGPLGAVRSAKRWVAALPANDPLAVQREVLSVLGKLSQRTARRTPASLEAVYFLDTHAGALVTTLLGQYVAHANRSPKLEEQLWQALSDLAGGFRDCYAAFAREIADHPNHRRWQALLHELIVRQIVHLGLDARLRLYRCERWAPTRYAELHALFTRACAQHVERRPIVVDPERGTTTAERQYLIVLVLSLADPGNLTPRQIDFIAPRLDEWCLPLRLTVTPRSSTTFYVDLAGGDGLMRRPLRPLEGRVLFLDTQPLLASLLQRRTALDQAIRGDPLSERTARQREELDVFVKLAGRIDPEFRPLARRGERSPASGSVDAIVGFKSISGFLHGGDASQAAESNLTRSYGNTMDLAVFGHTRKEPTYKIDPARRLIAAFVVPGSPWELKDVSTSGFRLHAPMSVATEITLSMLVAIRRRGHDAWVLGIVRRMRRMSGASAEIGLQLIANALASADLVEQRTPRSPDYSVSGEPTPRAGRRFRGIFLSYSRRPDEPPVQSLIVPAVEFQAARRYTLQTNEAPRVIRFGRILEQQSDWIWSVIEPAEGGAGATGAPSVR
jgi:hypothetical protein